MYQPFNPIVPLTSDETRGAVRSMRTGSDSKVAEFPAMSVAVTARVMPTPSPVRTSGLG